MAIGVNTQYVYVSCSISIKWYTLTHSNQHSSNNNHHLFIEYIRMSIHRFLFTSFFFLSSSSSCFSHLMMLLFFCRIVISDIDNISEIEIWQYHQEYSLHLYGKWKTKNCQSCNKGIAECRKSNIALSLNTSFIYLTIQQARWTIKSILKSKRQVPCWLISTLLLSLLLLSNIFIWNWIIQKREKHIFNDLYCILKIKNAKVSLINFIIVEHVMIGR